MDAALDGIALPQLVDQAKEGVGRQFEQVPHRSREPGPFDDQGKKLVEILDLALFLRAGKAQHRALPGRGIDVVHRALNVAILAGVFTQLGARIRLVEEGVGIGRPAGVVEGQRLEIVRQRAAGQAQHVGRQQLDARLAQQAAGLDDLLIREVALQDLVAHSWIARLQAHADTGASGLFQQRDLFWRHEIGPHIAEKRQAHLPRELGRQLAQPVGIDDEQIVEKDDELHGVAFLDPPDLLDDAVHAHLAQPLALAPVEACQGVVEAVGAIIGAAPAGDEMLDPALARECVLFEQQVAVGKGEPVQVVLQVPCWILLDVTVLLEPPIGYAAQRTAFLQGLHQVQDGLLALAPTDGIHPRLFDELGKVGRVRPAKDRHDIHRFLDPQVQVAVKGLRAGIDAIADHIRLPIAGHGDGVLVGGDSQAHLMAGLAEHAGQIEQAQRLVINLLFDKQHAHDSTLRKEGCL